MVFILRARYRSGVSGRIPGVRLPWGRGHLLTETRKISTGFNNYTICYTRLFYSPSGEWRVRVFRWTPGNSSAGQLRFVNQFCPSTIKARTSMLHLPILAPFANHIVDRCVNRGPIPRQLTSWSRQGSVVTIIQKHYVNSMLKTRSISLTIVFLCKRYVKEIYTIFMRNNSTVFYIEK